MHVHMSFFHLLRPSFSRPSLRRHKLVRVQPLQVQITAIRISLFALLPPPASSIIASCTGKQSMFAAALGPWHSLTNHLAAAPSPHYGCTLRDCTIA